jgi:hypothetical protein
MTLRDFLMVFDDGWVEVRDDDTNEILFATYQSEDWRMNKCLFDCADKEVVQINAYSTSEYDNPVLDVDCPVLFDDTIFYVRVV